jgi:hypothetical protein
MLWNGTSKFELTCSFCSSLLGGPIADCRNEEYEQTKLMHIVWKIETSTTANFLKCQQWLKRCHEMTP